MPTQVPIEVFMIGSTKVDKDEVARWMKFIGADNFEFPPEEVVTNPAALIALAGKRCYMSFEVGLNPNISKIRKDYVEYFDNILASGHGSVMEHSVYNFAIENVSRVFTAEMNRHRAGWAISEGSLRFIRFGDNIPYWEPDSIQGPDLPDRLREKYLGPMAEVPGVRTARGPLSYIGQIIDSVAFETAKLAEDGRENTDDLPGAVTNLIQDIAAECDMSEVDLRRALSRECFHVAFRHQEESYKRLELIWGPELAPTSKFAGKKQVTSMMRRIVGLGVATGGIWSGNIRALRHVFAMRASAHAEEEMIHVFSRLVKTMRDKEPLLFGDFYKDDAGFWRPKFVKV